MKSEIRNPKSETNSNSEVSNDKNLKDTVVSSLWALNFGFVSDFGFRISDFFRASAFGFPS